MDEVVLVATLQARGSWLLRRQSCPASSGQSLSRAMAAGIVRRPEIENQPLERKGLIFWDKREIQKGQRCYALPLELSVNEQCGLCGENHSGSFTVIYSVIYSVVYSVVLFHTRREAAGYVCLGLLFGKPQKS